MILLNETLAEIERIFILGFFGMAERGRENRSKIERKNVFLITGRGLFAVHGVYVITIDYYYLCHNFRTLRLLKWWTLKCYHWNALITHQFCRKS